MSSRAARLDFPLASTAARVAAVLAALALALCAFAPSAVAARGPGKFDQAQAGLGYTVYQPSITFGLKRTSFQLQDCGQGRDEMATANYGVEGRTAKWILIQESQTGCVDGPDSVAPAATFQVKGATATIKGECIEGSSCTKSTPAQVRKFAYTTVTLPATAELGPTYVEVYSAGLSVAEVRQFVRGLHPVS